ncbi:MAG: biotin/lipoyl-containing protein [Paraglaciecola sp.]|uniref:biotin/lipoyl-containing protein n=1 Tax=Paraglaciecola sp. TaxID=1920173 RepID=UPI0032989CD2
MTNVITENDIWEGLEQGTEALLDEWLVEDGADVEIGQPIALIVVVKANHEIMAPKKGAIKILVAGQDSFTKDQPLAEIV